MRSLRLAITVLALTLIAAACSDDGDDDGDTAEQVTTTTAAAVITTTTEPFVVPPTSSQPVLPPEPVVQPITTSSTTTTLPPVGVAPPIAPSNVACRAGSAPNELTVEFDALPDPSAVSKIRVYVSGPSGDMITNGEYTLGEIDTTRAGGTRWAARARNIEPGVQVRLTATSFNQLGRESGWYVISGVYTGQGQPCGSLPAPSTTAG